MARFDMKALTVDVAATCCRFPLPVLVCALFTVLAVDPGEQLSDFIGEDGFNRLLASLFVAFFMLFAGAVAADARRGSRLLAHGGALLAAGAVGLALFLPATESAFESRAPYLAGAGVLAALAAVGWMVRRNSNGPLWTWCYRLLLRTLLGGVAATVLFLGTAAILASLEFLFDIEIDYRLYEDLQIVAFALFGPVFVLAGVPRFDPAAEPPAPYPRIFLVLVAFIAVPLLGVYALILHAYTARIALTQVLPEGGVVWLVAGFALSAVAAWFALHPAIRRAEHPIARWFGVALFPALLVPLGLMAVAIFVRVADYGITGERYAVLLALLWLALVPLLALLTRGDALRKILTALCLLLVVAAVGGPIGARGLTTMSQTARLDRLLIEAGVYRDGALVKPAEQPDGDTYRALADQLDFFYHSGRQAELQEALPGVEPAGSTTAPRPSDAERYSAAEVLKSLGIDEQSRSDFVSADPVRTYGLYANAPVWPVVDTTGFERSLAFRFTRFTGNAEETFSISLGAPGDAGSRSLELRSSLESQTLEIRNPATNNSVLFDLSELNALMVPSDAGGTVEHLYRRTETLDDLKIAIVVESASADDPTPGFRTLQGMLLFDLPDVAP